MNRLKSTSHELRSCLFILFVICASLFQSCGSAPKFTGNEQLPNTEKKLPPLTETDHINQYDKETTPLEITTGVASYYGEKFNDRQTASGEIYNMNELTAAHLTYPFGTIVRVINTKNNKSVILKINDRMPDYNGRVIDVSHKAAEELGMLIDGLAKVSIEVLSWGEKK